MNASPGAMQRAAAWGLAVVSQMGQGCSVGEFGGGFVDIVNRFEL